jgi:hypothetical protein
MANRFYENRSYTLEKATVSLYGVFTCTGANNAQTAVRSKGIASVVQTATGVWTITLQDQYNALLGFSACILGAGTVSDSYLTANNVASSAKTLVFQWLSPAGSPTSPAVNNVAYLEINLSNSSAL